MSRAVETRCESDKRTLRRRRTRRARRRVLGAVPVVVWVASVVMAARLHQDMRTSAVLTGYVDDQPVKIAHLEPGVVGDVRVALHEQVTRGQILVRIDDQEERIALAAIERDIERLRAEVLAAREGQRADNARAAHAVEELARQFAIDRESAHIEYLAQLAANARNRVLLRGASVELEITRELHEQNSAAYRELNDVRAKTDALAAELELSMGVLERMRTAFQEADQRWFRFLIREDVSSEVELAQAPLRLAIDVRRHDLEEVVRRIDAHILRAPIDGQVTALYAHAGETVDVGDPVAVISPSAGGRVVAYLPEAMVRSVNVGAPVSIGCAGEAGGSRSTHAGTIVSLSATVVEAPRRCWPTPSYPVWGRAVVAALNDGACLIPGEAVTIGLMADAAK